MLISGTIQSVTPPDYRNNFGVQYQNITIDTVNGPVIGRIGKKQPYTQQNIGHQDQWDMEQAQGPQGPYNKLKKHYDQPYQGGSQGAPQGTPQATGQAQAPDNRGIYIIRQAILKAVLPAAEIPLDMVNDYLLASMQFVFTGKWDLQTAAKSNPAMSGEDYGPPQTGQEDNIPF